MKEITKALCLFMQDVPPLTKMSTAKIQGKNGGKGFAFDFAELGYICSVINPVLAKHSLHIMHTNRVVDKVDHLVTTIMHESGESISSEVQIPTNLNPNKLYSFGSAETYLRRYVTLGMLNLWHGVDDAGIAFEPVEDLAKPTATTYEDTKLINPEAYLDKKTKEDWVKELTIMFNRERPKFDELSNAFKSHFKVDVVSDALTQEKHAQFILNYLHKKEVAA